MTDVEVPSLRLMVSGTCFWSLEAVFSSLRGVSNTACGWIWMAAGLPPQESAARHPVERMEVVVFDWKPTLLPPQAVVQVLVSVTCPELEDWMSVGEMSGMRSLIAGTSPLYRHAFVSAISDASGRRVQGSGVPLNTQVLETLPTWKRAPDSDQQFFFRCPVDPFSKSMIVPKMLKLEQRFASLKKSIGVVCAPVPGAEGMT